MENLLLEFERRGYHGAPRPLYMNITVQGYDNNETIIQTAAEKINALTEDERDELITDIDYHNHDFPLVSAQDGQILDSDPLSDVLDQMENSATGNNGTIHITATEHPINA